MPDHAILPKEIELDLFASCRHRLPNETCGILFGCDTGNQAKVDGFAVIRNEARHPREAFRFSPEDWAQAYYEAQKNQRKIVGFFHSHPGGRPLPSIQDSKGWLPWGTYWIVGFSEESCGIAVYVSDPILGWRPLPLNAG
jgi:proteasome lid subunit RPN8/RPN11